MRGAHRLARFHQGVVAVDDELAAFDFERLADVVLEGVEGSADYTESERPTGPWPSNRHD